MNTFVVVIGRAAGSVARAGDRIRSTPVAELVAEGVLARLPDAVHQWETGDRRVAVAAWETAPQALGVRSRWAATDDRRVTTFSGHPWRTAGAWATDRSWAEQMGDDADRAARPHRRPPTYDGIYSAVTVDGHGTGHVTCDPLGMELLYYGRTADHLVVSTRAAVVAWLVTAPGERPGPDLESAASLAFAGVPLDDRTGFTAVRCLPQGAHVRLDGAGAVICEPVAPPWLRCSGIDLDDAVDSIGAGIRATLRRVVDLPTAAPLFELTGGKDSRLLLAHAVAEGIAQEFTYVTWGSAHLPDVQISDAVLTHLGLPRHAPGRPGRSTPTAPADPAPRETAREAFDRQFRHHLTTTSGAASSWDMRSAGPVSERPSVCGIMGEILRGTQPRTGWFTSFDQLEAFVRLGGFATDPARLLRPEARRHEQDRMIAAFRSVRTGPGAPQDAIDGYYLSVRLRRWFGAFNEHEHRSRVFPLYSLEAAQAAFALGGERRLTGVLPYELMERAAPGLARLPFEGAGWPASLARHRDVDGLPLAPTSSETTMRRAISVATSAMRGGVPVPALQAVAEAARRRYGDRRQTGAPAGGPPTAMSGTLVEAAHTTDLTAKVAALRHTFDIDRSHPLHAVIDPEAARSALDRFGSLGYFERRGLHDAATAIAWTSGELGPARAPFPEAGDHPDV